MRADAAGAVELLRRSCGGGVADAGWCGGGGEVAAAELRRSCCGGRFGRAAAAGALVWCNGMRAQRSTSSVGPGMGKLRAAAVLVTNYQIEWKIFR